MSHVTHEFVGWRADWQILLLNIPLCLACSVPVGAAFFLLVERRFLNSPLEQPTTAEPLASLSPEI